MFNALFNNSLFNLFICWHKLVKVRNGVASMIKAVVKGQTNFDIKIPLSTIKRKISLSYFLFYIKEIKFKVLKPIVYCIIKYFVSYYYVLGLALDIKNLQPSLLRLLSDTDSSS
jgi:hypothetical protein